VLFIYFPATPQSLLRRLF